MTQQDAIAYQDLTTAAQHVLGEVDDSPEYLYRTILQAYTADELLVFPQVLEKFLVQHGDHVRAIVDEHSPGAQDYVERYDALYRTAEVLLIAERSVKRPRMLRSMIAGSDFEDMLHPMIDTFSVI